MSDSQLELPATVPIPVRGGFLTRARRRGVLRVAGSYAVIAWLLLQIADVTFDPLGVPKWVMTSLIVAAVLGFPVAVALAWFYEVGDHGLQRDTAAEDAVRPSVHGKRRFTDLAIIGVLLIAVAVLLVRQSDIGKRPPPSEPGDRRPAFREPERQPATGVLLRRPRCGGARPARARARPEGNRQFFVVLVQGQEPGRPNRRRATPERLHPQLPWIKSLEGERGYAELIHELEKRRAALRAKVAALDAAPDSPTR